MGKKFSPTPPPSPMSPRAFLGSLWRGPDLVHLRRKGSTSPKTNGWIPKMMVWKRRSPLKYGHVRLSMLDFWGVQASACLLGGLAEVLGDLDLVPVASTYGRFTYMYYKNQLKCRQIYDTWTVWGMLRIPTNSWFFGWFLKARETR